MVRELLINAKKWLFVPRIIYAVAVVKNGQVQT